MASDGEQAAQATGAGQDERATSADPVLQAYISKGVQDIVADALRAALKDPRESAFMARYARAAAEASKRRDAAEERGEHVPPFLIASITSSCNLHCAGCYARYNQMCTDDLPADQLAGAEWERIFLEARELGVGFILLAGGEPLLRRDVLDAAASIPQILFPVFTNGTLVSGEYLELFDRARNLIPVFSIEGARADTDARRGTGVYDLVSAGIEGLHRKGLIFGISVTVTAKNIREVTSEEFLDSLAAAGCKVVFYVEYVPVTRGTAELAPGGPERAYLAERTGALREAYPDTLFLCFPGDERASGGCIAAGRGFFHINPHGGAEPCPFSPYSDINVRDTSLKEALDSPLFVKLREGDMLMQDHGGACVLFEQRGRVGELLGQE